MIENAICLFLQKAMIMINILWKEYTMPSCSTRLGMVLLLYTKGLVNKRKKNE